MLRRPHVNMTLFLPLLMCITYASYFTSLPDTMRTNIDHRSQAHGRGIAPVGRAVQTPGRGGFAAVTDPGQAAGRLRKVRGKLKWTGDLDAIWRDY